MLCLLAYTKPLLTHTHMHRHNLMENSSDNKSKRKTLNRNSALKLPTVIIKDQTRSHSVMALLEKKKLLWPNLAFLLGDSLWRCCVRFLRTLWISEKSNKQTLLCMPDQMTRYCATLHKCCYPHDQHLDYWNEGVEAFAWKLQACLSPTWGYPLWDFRLLDFETDSHNLFAPKQMISPFFSLNTGTHMQWCVCMSPSVQVPSAPAGHRLPRSRTVQSGQAARFWSRACSVAQRGDGEGSGPVPGGVWETAEETGGKTNRDMKAKIWLSKE